MFRKPSGASRKAWMVYLSTINASNIFFENLGEILENLGWFTRASSIVDWSASNSFQGNLDEFLEKLGWFTRAQSIVD